MAPYNSGAKGGSRRINNPAVKREIVRVTKSVCFDFRGPYYFSKIVLRQRDSISCN